MADTASPPPLVPLGSAPGDLEIVKASWRHQVQELVADAGPVARINPAAWSGKAKVETTDGAWAFSRPKGFRNRRVEIVAVPSDEPVAEYVLDTWKRGGRIELAGRTYRLRASGVFKTTWTWTRDDVEVARLDRTASMKKQKGTATVAPGGREDPNALLLLLLAVHAGMAEDNDTTAATVAVTS